MWCHETLCNPCSISRQAFNVAPVHQPLKGFCPQAPILSVQCRSTEIDGRLKTSLKENKPAMTHEAVGYQLLYSMRAKFLSPLVECSRFLYGGLDQYIARPQLGILHNGIPLRMSCVSGRDLASSEIFTACEAGAEAEAKVAP